MLQKAVARPKVGLNPNRDRRVALLLATVWLIVFVFATTVIQPWRPEVPLSNDFVAFWTGALLLRDGAGPVLFDPDVQTRFQANLRLALTGTETMRTGDLLDPFHSPPIQGLLLLPLTVLPLHVAYLVFSLGSLLATVAAIALLLRGYTWGATATVGMVSFAAVSDTLMFGQVNAQFVLALSLALVALRSGRPFVGGMLLGALWLKPQYAILFPVVFVIKRRWRELAGMVVAGGAMAAVSVALVGVEGALRYAAMMREIGGFYAPPDEFIFPQSMVNWRAVIVHLAPGIAEDTGRTLMLLLGAATYAVSLLAWRGPWEPRSARFGCQILVLLLATVVGSPHSNFHGMVVTLPALALCLSRQDPIGVRRGVLYGLLAVGYVMTYLIWPDKSSSWLLVPPLMTLLAVLLAQRWPVRFLNVWQAPGDSKRSRTN